MKVKIWIPICLRTLEPRETCGLSILNTLTSHLTQHLKMLDSLLLILPPHLTAFHPTLFLRGDNRQNESSEIKMGQVECDEARIMIILTSKDFGLMIRTNNEDV